VVRVSAFAQETKCNQVDKSDRWKDLPDIIVTLTAYNGGTFVLNGRGQGSGRQQYDPRKNAKKKDFLIRA
jgi:hypothetical protein